MVLYLNFIRIVIIFLYLACQISLRGDILRLLSINKTFTGSEDLSKMNELHIASATRINR